MSELAQLARPLIDQPLVERPDVSALRSRNRRRRAGRSTHRPLCLLWSSPWAGLSASRSWATRLTRHRRQFRCTFASYFEASVNVPRLDTGSGRPAAGLCLGADQGHADGRNGNHQPGGQLSRRGVLPLLCHPALGAARGALSVRHLLQPQRSGALLIVTGLSEPCELELHWSPLHEPLLHLRSDRAHLLGAGRARVLPALGEDECCPGGRLRPLRPAGRPALCQPGEPVRHDRRERISLSTGRPQLGADRLLSERPDEPSCPGGDGTRTTSSRRCARWSPARSPPSAPRPRRPKRSAFWTPGCRPRPAQARTPRRRSPRPTRRCPFGRSGATSSTLSGSGLQPTTTG